MVRTKDVAAKAQELLEGGFGAAREVLGNSEKLNELVSSARASLNSYNVAKETMGNITTLVEMVGDYASGAYREIPLKSIVAVVSAVLYWVAPVDLVPDAIPLAGKVDDAAVAAACVAQIGEDLDAYREWRAARA